MTRAEALAAFFRLRPHVWVDGRELAGVAGAYAWRTRISDLRRPPFGMTLENRLRRVQTAQGAAYVVSEYRWQPPPDDARDGRQRRLAFEPDAAVP